MGTDGRCRSVLAGRPLQTRDSWVGAVQTHPLANANRGSVPGILRAYDASDLRHELWNSGVNPSHDDLGTYAKFSAPTIATGRVYVATFSGEVAVYGLL